MPIHQLIPSFNAGEISPMLDARVSLEKYASGCRTLQNFIILPYGGAMRRPGTEYIGAAKNSAKRSRVVGFNFSSSVSFILEIGEYYIRFWNTNGPVTVTGTPVEVVTPYTEAEIRDVQFVQINDIMYFVHPLHSPRKLVRNSDTNWTFSEIDWTWPVFLDENIEATTIIPYPVTFTAWLTSTAYLAGAYVTNSGTLYRCLTGHTSGTFATDLAAAKWIAASITAGTSVSLTSSASIFQASHVGSYWCVAHVRETAYIERVLSSTGTSGNLDVLGKWELTTYGNWDGRLKVQRSYDGGTTWETIRTYESATAGERNVSSTGSEDKPCQMRLDYSADAAGSASPNSRLECGDNRIYGVVKITGYTSATVVTATVINAIYSPTATKIWQEGAFSAVRGFPRTVTLHEQRLIFAGTDHKPLTIWGSVTDDFENFRVSVLDDGSFSFSLSSNVSNPVNWMTSQNALLIGTAGDEWTLGATDTTKSMSPTNVMAKRQSSYGSKYLQARVINEVIMFTQRQGRKVRELTYSFQKDGWVAPDLTLLANHITAGEIVETAFQQQTDAILWLITGTGGLIGMTYERDQNVVGWHRHTTQGTFESVATIYGGSGADEVWFVVNRTVNGSTVRYLERLKVDHRETMEAEDKPNWWYLDCAKQVAPSGVTASGLSHLEGLEVGVLKDGSTHPARTVVLGSISLQATGSKVLVGLPFESILQPMKLNIDLQDGTAQGRRARVPRLVARFYKSLGGQYSTDGKTWFDIFSRSTTDKMDDSPDAFTGDKKVYTGGTYADSADVWLKQTLPMPLTVLAIMPKWEAIGD